MPPDFSDQEQRDKEHQEFVDRRDVVFINRNTKCGGCHEPKAARCPICCEGHEKK